MIQEEQTFAMYQVRYYRARLDDLWMELETARDWYHIKQIAKELEEIGKLHREWKQKHNDLTYGKTSASM